MLECAHTCEHSAVYGHDEMGLKMHLNVTLRSGEELWVSSQVTEGDVACEGCQAGQSEVNEGDCHPTGGCLYGMTPASLSSLCSCRELHDNCVCVLLALLHDCNV